MYTITKDAGRTVLAGPFDTWKLAAGSIDNVRKTTPNAKITRRSEATTAVAA